MSNIIKVKEVYNKFTTYFSVYKIRAQCHQKRLLLNNSPRSNNLRNRTHLRSSNLRSNNPRRSSNPRSRIPKNPKQVKSSSQGKSNQKNNNPKSPNPQNSKRSNPLPLHSQLSNNSTNNPKKYI
jgi:hypothetical protein